MRSLALHPTSRLVDRVRIAAPCPASWDDMVGDERTRFCGQCAKNVYEVSAMTADEVASLITATEGRACLRLYRRKDGTVITSDCPVGLAERAYKRARKTVLATVALVVTVASGLFGGLFKSTSAVETPQHATLGLMVMEPAPVIDEGQPMMGEVMILPEPEPRALMGKPSLD